MRLVGLQDMRLVGLLVDDMVLIIVIPQVAGQKNKLWSAKASYTSRFSLPSEVPQEVQQKLEELRAKGNMHQHAHVLRVSLQPFGGPPDQE